MSLTKVITNSDVLNYNYKIRNLIGIYYIEYYLNQCYTGIHIPDAKCEMLTFR